MNLKTLLGAALLASVTASQANIQLLGTSLGQELNLTYPSTTRNIWCGQLRILNLNTNVQFKAMCGDITQVVNPLDQWLCTQTTTNTLSPQYQAAGHLIANVFPTLTTNDQAAALNVAIWELFYDFGATPDFNNGLFKVNGGPANVINLATSYYNTYKNGSGVATAYLPLPGGYGQIQLTPVPEPGAMLALVAGGAMLIARRRKA